MPIKLCSGFTLTSLEPIHLKYPFARHSNGQLNWSMPNDAGTIFAKQCSTLLPDGCEVSTCDSCRNLGSDKGLARLVEMAQDDELHKSSVKNVYLNHTQLSARGAHHKAKADKARLYTYRERRKLARLGATLADHQKILLMLQKNNVKRTREFLTRMQDRGASPAMIVKKLALAIQGKYTPRPEISVENLDKTEHALILGGSRLLHALQQNEGYLSQSTLVKHRERKCFISSWNSNVYPKTIATNLENFALAKAPPPAKKIYTLMFDGVALEPRRRVSLNDNKVRGYTRQGDFGGLDLNLTCMQSLIDLEAAEKEGRIELAEEVDVFAIGANDETNYAISLLAASATAKKGASSVSIAPIITNCVIEWKAKAWEQRGPITTIAHDGASIMNQAVFPFATEFQIDHHSKVGAELYGEDGDGLLLFHDRCASSARLQLSSHPVPPLQLAAHTPPCVQQQVRQLTRRAHR